MKIAILYSGQPRYVKETIDNHNKVIFAFNGNNHVDVYAHFWENLSNSKNTNYWGDSSRGVWRDEDVKNFVEKYNPKKIITESSKDFMITDISCDARFPHPINNVFSMFYSMYKSFSLLEEEYDCIVRIRSDVIFHDNIGDLSNYNMDGINLMNNTHAPYAVNDTFAFGSHNKMRTYFDTYNNIRKLISMGCIINPECLRGYNLQVLNNIKCLKHNWNFNFYGR